MVQFSIAQLDRTFHALADATRREILASLCDRRRAMAVSEIARPFEMSLPAVLKHIAVLEGAGLVAREKRGRTVFCRLTAEPLAEADAWLAAYEQFWSGALDRLTTYLENETCQQPQSSSDPTPRASRSAARSKPRRSGSSPRSRGRKT